jgi:hypothetical protein
MIRPLIVGAVAAVIGLGTLYIEGPGLMRDVKLRNAALVPASDLRVEQAKCTSYYHLLSNCLIRYSGPQLREKQAIHFSVLGTLGGQHFRLMRSADRRTVTTDIGIAKLTNRIAAAIFFVGLMGFVCFFSCRKALAGLATA